MMFMQLLFDNGKVFSTGDELEGQLVLREVQHVPSLNAKVSLSCFRILCNNARDDVRSVCYHRELSWACNVSQFNSASSAWQKEFKIELDDSTIGLPSCISRAPNDNGYVEVKWVLKAEVAANGEKSRHKPHNYCEIAKVLKVCPAVDNEHGSVSFTAADSREYWQMDIRLPDGFAFAPRQLEAKFSVNARDTKDRPFHVQLKEVQTSKASFSRTLKYFHSLSELKPSAHDSKTLLLGDLMNDVSFVTSDDASRDDVFQRYYDDVEVLNFSRRQKSYFLIFIMPARLKGAISWEIRALQK